MYNRGDTYRCNKTGIIFVITHINDERVWFSTYPLKPENPCGYVLIKNIESWFTPYYNKIEMMQDLINE